MSTDTDLYPPTLLKVGVQGIILAVNHKKDLLVYFLGDVENRWIAIDSYPKISLMPHIRIYINEEFMSTATYLYPSTLLKVGMRGVLIEINDKKDLLVYIAGDTDNR